jgi:hypothetical protein
MILRFFPCRQGDNGEFRGFWRTGRRRREYVSKSAAQRDIYLRCVGGDSGGPGRWAAAYVGTPGRKVRPLRMLRPDLSRACEHLDCHRVT